MRGLGEGKEVAGVDPARNQIVTSPFRGAFGQYRRLDFEEAVIGQIVANGLGNLVPHHQVFLDRFTTQVQVPVFKAQVLSDFGKFIKHERWCLGVVENAQLTYFYLDFSGRHLRIDRPVRTWRNFTKSSNDEFITDILGFGVCLRIPVWVQCQLSDTGAVTQVDKDQTTVVATTMCPAHQTDLQADMFAAQFTTIVGSFPVAEYVVHSFSSGLFLYK